MRRRTLAATAGASLLCLSTTVGLAAASAAPATAKLAGTAGTATARAHAAGAIAASSMVSFDVTLVERDPAAAAALVKAVSDPTSSQYRHYVTAAEWEARFSPTEATVTSVVAWLHSQHLTTGTVSADRMTIPTSGTAAHVEKAFGVGLGSYSVLGQRLREASGNVSVPASLAGAIGSVRGLSEVLAQSEATTDEAPVAGAAPVTTAKGSKDPAPPGAFITAKPCGTSFGSATTTTTFSEQHPGYAKTLPDAVCGYVPGQLRSAYSIAPTSTGKRATIAIVDAYDSATIASDATRYFAQNDPSAPVTTANFHQTDLGPFDDQTVCLASGWQDEEAIDIESAHGLAPAAHVLYVGAKDCENGLYDADQYVIDGGLANVISNSWADTDGDLLLPASDLAATDQMYEMADATGITVQFSSGDDGDNFELTGISAANYPASSPYVTAVGGTTLEINADGQQTGQYGWSTGRSLFCRPDLVNLYPANCTPATVNTYLPPALDGASGGFTSYAYPQPYYQKGVVPAGLALRNKALTGTTPMRVVPDISLEADPATGFMIGLTETMANGTVKYDQTRYGGTSLASPILAGIVADIDGESALPVGFLNPVVYKLDTTKTGAINDIVPGGKMAQYRADHIGQLFGKGARSLGSLTQVREITWEGKYVFCDGSGDCSSQDAPLTTTKGYDSMTGIGAPGPDFVSDVAKA